MIELSNLLEDICKHMSELKQKLSSSKIDTIQIHGGIIKRGFTVSDVDIGVSPKRHESMFNAIRSAEKILYEVLKTPITYEVKPDIIAKNYIHLDLKDIEKFCGRISDLTFITKEYVDAIINEIKQTKAYKGVSSVIDTIMEEEQKCFKYSDPDTILACHSEIYHANRNRLGKLFEWEYLNVPEEARITRRT